jgi:predicted Abi (CAAX) family protease
MHLVTDRLLGAVTTLPAARTWGRCALAYAVFLACAVPIGVVSGLLHPSLPDARPAEIAGTCLMVFVHPAFVEEMIFRALLLPRNAASMRRSRLFLAAGVALALYVASHPLNAVLFRPQALGLFASPAYLTLAAMLGATCTWAYVTSRSIWPPVTIHWLTVVAWIWLLGGRALV